jgi:flavin reductase (DIM6/NTAB) family NADH-FMN oxidoreductase RutF
MPKIVVEDIGRFNHQYPRTTAIVTARYEGQSNAMAVAWHTAISFKPPVYGIAVASIWTTYKLITGSKEFGVNFVPFEAAEKIAAVGGSGGRYIDKFERFDLAREKPAKTSVPILEAAYATYECRLMDDRPYGDHNMLVGEIVAVHMLEEAFTEEKVLDLSRVSPALFMGIDYYLSTDRNSLKFLDRKKYGRA